MNDEILSMGQRILMERGFTEDPDSGLNVIRMRRQFGADLEILVWTRFWSDGLNVQVLNPSSLDGERVWIAEISQEVELITVIDALIQAFQIIASPTAHQLTLLQ